MMVFKGKYGKKKCSPFYFVLYIFKMIYAMESFLKENAPW